jgi:Core-2/I-Branching enzyme
MPPVGFVLLTHNKPKQIIRLVNTLNRMFDSPPIACHHDFTKCNLPSEAFTKNILFVHPHFPTGWGRFSVIDGMFRALQLLYESKNSPDWFILLSGADYPIKPAKRILQDLTTSEYDAHIHHEKIIYNNYRTDWQELCHKRYCSVRFSVPFEIRNLNVDPRLPQLTKHVITLRHPILTRPFLPFSKNFSCFAGEFWFTANCKAAKYLIEYHRTRPALASHYRRLEKYNIICPEESYYQTILCNSPTLKISQNNWRYVDWSKGWPPKTLLLEDLAQLQECSAHFARKFDIDTDVEILNALDNLSN